MLGKCCYWTAVKVECGGGVCVPHGQWVKQGNPKREGRRMKISYAKSYSATHCVTAKAAFALYTVSNWDRGKCCPLSKCNCSMESHMKS